MKGEACERKSQGGEKFGKSSSSQKIQFSSFESFKLNGIPIIKLGSEEHSSFSCLRGRVERRGREVCQRGGNFFRAKMNLERKKSQVNGPRVFLVCDRIKNIVHSTKQNTNTSEKLHFLPFLL